MKNPFSLFARAALLLPFVLVPMGPSDGSARKPDFSEFAGRYRGDVVVYGSNVAVGNAKVTATTSKGGKSLRLRVLGVLSGNGLSAGYVGTIHFKSARRYRIDSADFNLSGNTTGARGRYRLQNRNLRFQGSGALDWGERILVDGKIVSSGDGRSVRITHRITFPEQGNITYRFHFAVTRNGRR